MTIRDDIRNHFETEAARHPVPYGLRPALLAGARHQAIEHRGPNWVAGAVAVVLAVAIIAGLLAVSAMRHSQVAPVHASKLLFHDHLSAVVTGLPSLPDVQQFQAHFPSLALTAALPGAPALGSVYQLDPKLAPTPAEVGAVWGVTPTRTSAGEVQMGDITYYPASGAIEYSRPNNPQAVRVDGPGHLANPITDEASAISMARDFLVARGLFSRDEVQSMTGSAQRIVHPAPNLPFWSILISRTLDGRPDYGFGFPGAMFQVADNGRIDLISVVRRPIAGHEELPLITAAEAWKQITLGHWYVADGVLNMVESNQAPFVADKAELCYWEGSDVSQTQAWLVPMWCFTGSGGLPILYYPALAPGTFDWTVPTH
jgi:hypothetical protein